MKDNKLKYILALSMILMGPFLISCGSSGGGDSASAEIQPVETPAAEEVVVTPEPITVKGTGYATDEDGFRASLSLDVNEASLSTSWLRFSYRTDYLVSTSITEISESGGDVTVWTIKGTGTLNNDQEGYTFTGTITDSDPQKIAIEILDPDGAEYLTISLLLS